MLFYKYVPYWAGGEGYPEGSSSKSGVSMKVDMF